MTVFIVEKILFSVRFANKIRPLIFRVLPVVGKLGACSDCEKWISFVGFLLGGGTIISQFGVWSVRLVVEGSRYFCSGK